jgi:hypothetical protein
VIVFALLLQISAADSTYQTAALREFVGRAAVENRAPPRELAGYGATVETELALILRDSIGREIVGQLEQLAALASWQRASGQYDLHVVGFRSQSLGAPYSALTFTRMYTVPTLYGGRLVIGMNDGLPRPRVDTAAVRRAVQKDSAQGRERYRAIHPLAMDRDRYYRFTGGDTVATVVYSNRRIPLVRVFVEPVRRPESNFAAFQGELDFDADRHQLVRMRGRLVTVSSGKDPLFARATGAVAIAFMEFENAEIDGQYWLPAYQRSEFQAQMALLGDTRPVYRIVSRFRDYTIRTDTTSVADLPDTLPRTRARLTFASRDSVSRYTEWQENLGAASGKVSGGDFDDLAPDAWRSTGEPVVRFWPRHLEELARYNRVEGMYTGIAGSVQFRDVAPGLSMRGSMGMGWTSHSVRGGISAALTRGQWIHAARVERTLASTNDFLLSLESGLSLGPLFGGNDDSDYLDRRLAALNTTRVFRDVDRAMLTVEGALVEDRTEIARLEKGVFGGERYRPNRNATPGRYARGTAKLEWHPRVTGESLAPGFGARLTYEIAAGDLDWQRVEARLALRQYWRGIVLASRLDAGAVFGSVLPPQVLYEVGGVYDLPSYEYKEFGGDRAAVGRALAAYYLPIGRTPLRIGRLVLPGISPGIGAGIQGGWTDATTDAARAALLALGGDGVTPLSRPTDRIRATADLRVTLLSGAIGFGISRPVDQPGEWKPFFVWGASF